MKQKPKNLNEEGMEVSPINGLKSPSDIASLANATKYDLRNYSHKDALALRVAYLADKTWIRDTYDPHCVWSSSHGTAKRTGEHSSWGFGKPQLIGMVDKVTSLLKRKYSENPEKLKELISECSLSESEIERSICRSKERPFLFRTSSESEINARDYVFEEYRPKDLKYWTVKAEQRDNETSALTLGRLYLSDIARRAYSELTGKRDFPKESSFVERVVKSIDTHQSENLAKAAGLVNAAINSMEIYQAIFR